MGSGQTVGGKVGGRQRTKTSAKHVEASDTVLALCNFQRLASKTRRRPQQRLS